MYTCAAAHYRDAHHDLLCGMGSITSRPYPPSTPNQLQMHACMQAPREPRTHRPPRSRAIHHVLPTIAWLIAAPPSNSARTHSTNPFSLAMYRGVASSVCNATRNEEAEHAVCYLHRYFASRLVDRSSWLRRFQSGRGRNNPVSPVSRKPLYLLHACGPPPPRLRRSWPPTLLQLSSSALLQLPT
jgi:hypothetical protein